MRSFIASLVIICTLINSYSLFANPVDSLTAKKTAINFYFERINQVSKVDYFSLRISNSFTKYADGRATYYVFSFSDHGFIIVSSEDNVYPVLGYSFNNPYIPENQNIAFTEWMNNYEQQILNARENRLPSTEAIKDTWDYYSSATFNPFEYHDKLTEVTPLLTSTWNQIDYYNEMCPADTAGFSGHSPAGCVAVAMAQVMYYFRYPLKGTGSHSYVSPTYGLISADFENTEYKWNQMLNFIYNESNPAIAELIFHCGIATDMNYGPQGSGTSTEKITDALVTYFNYSPEIQFIGKDTTENWKELLIDNLDNRRPVIYKGSQGWSGHSFVCDGYQGDDFFHFNWGWSGDCNGYFYLDNLNPGGYDFTDDQCAVINIYPQGEYPYYCDGTDTLKTKYGSFEDGSGPKDYPDNLSCRWLISPEDTSINNIELKFTYLDTEPDHDFLTVYDGATISDPIIGTFSGTSIPDVITTENNKLLLVFTSDDSTTASGWQATYYGRSEPFCDSLTTVTSLASSFEDCSGPYQYTNNTKCKWLIAPLDNEHDSVSSIDLRFISLDTETDEDVVIIYNGATENDPVLGMFSGHTIPPPMQSAGDRVLINFSSNDSITGKGWRIKYTSVIPVYCHDTTYLTRETDTLDDGSGHRKYNNDTECYWLIEPIDKKIIQLDFLKFELEHNYDKVEIYDPTTTPATLLARCTGFEIPDPVVASNGKMLIRFLADYSIVYDGWEACYTSSNTGIDVHATIQDLTIFPNPSDDKLSLSFHLRDKRDLFIRLISLKGEVVYSSEFKKAEGKFTRIIDVHSFSKNIYLLQILTDDDLITRKVVIK
jgi:hypothetical protein